MEDVVDGRMTLIGCYGETEISIFVIDRATRNSTPLSRISDHVAHGSGFNEFNVAILLSGGKFMRTEIRYFVVRISLF